MRTEEEMTPLLLAAEMRTLEVVRTLLQADPQPDIAAINERNHTALMLAARLDTPSVVASLLEAGAAVDATMGDGWTALMLAAHDGCLPTVRVLLSKKACVNTVAADGWTPLLSAIDAPDPSEALVRLLLGAGADPAGVGGRTAPLYLAAEVGATAVVTALLAATPPAPLEATAADGSTAVLVAAQNGHATTLKVLLDAGARADAMRMLDDGNSGLHLAVVYDHLEAVRTLIGSPTVDVAAAIANGYCPLHLAAERATTGALKLLLAAGAPVGATTPDGTTALHLAAAAGEIQSLDALLEAGALPAAATHAGVTQLMEAASAKPREAGHRYCMDALLALTSDDELGEAAAVAARVGMPQVVNFLNLAAQRRATPSDTDKDQAGGTAATAAAEQRPGRHGCRSGGGGNGRPRTRLAAAVARPANASGVMAAVTEASHGSQTPGSAGKISPGMPCQRALLAAARHAPRTPASKNDDAEEYEEEDDEDDEEDDGKDDEEDSGGEDGEDEEEHDDKGTENEEDAPRRPSATREAERATRSLPVRGSGGGEAAATAEADNESTTLRRRVDARPSFQQGPYAHFGMPDTTPPPGSSIAAPPLLPTTPPLSLQQPVDSNGPARLGASPTRPRSASPPQSLQQK